MVMMSLGLKQVREFGLNFPLNPDLYIVAKHRHLSRKLKVSNASWGNRNYLELAFVFHVLQLQSRISRQLQTVSSQSSCFFSVSDGFSPSAVPIHRIAALLLGEFQKQGLSLRMLISLRRPRRMNLWMEALGAKGVNASHRAIVQG